MRTNSEVVKNKRITVIDALRGFALFGIIIRHTLLHFGISSDVETSEDHLLIADIINWISHNIINGRFINIFACLFGLSFFIQMDGAAKKGIDFRKRFLWRMAILFFIGLLSNCFFPYDILSIYAVFGTVLVFLFPLNNKVLIVIAFLLLLGTPRLLMFGYQHITNTEQIAENNILSPIFPETDETAKTSFIHSVKKNMTEELRGKLIFQFGMIGRGYLTMALFIFGLVIGRLQFFKDIQDKQKRNIKLFVFFTLATFLLSFILYSIPQKSLDIMMLMTPRYQVPFGAVLISTLNDINTVLASGILAMGFIIIYQTKSIGKILEVIVSYGRMGLTNYVMQGVLGAFIFSMWAFGAFFGTFNTPKLFLLGLAIYIIQIVISKYWLQKFLYGPLEWFWRSATYLKWQPLRKIKNF